MAKKWYVVHTLTGKEDAVKKSLENQLASNPDSAKFVGTIMVPTEKVAEIKEGEKKISERKFFPPVRASMERGRPFFYSPIPAKAGIQRLGLGWIHSCPVQYNCQKARRILFCFSSLLMKISSVGSI